MDCYTSVNSSILVILLSSFLFCHSASAALLFCNSDPNENNGRKSLLVLVYK